MQMLLTVLMMAAVTRTKNILNSRASELTGRQLYLAQINFGDLTPYFTYVYCIAGSGLLKGPKCEIFDSGVFAQIGPIWIGDLGTRPKNNKF